MGIYNVSAIESVDGVVTKVHWTYTNDEGSNGGVHTLPTPEGSVPLSDVTELLAESWLLSTLLNTTEELAAVITSRLSVPPVPLITYF